MGLTSGVVAWPVKHSNVMDSRPCRCRFGTGSRCLVLLEKGNRHLHEANQPREAWSALKIYQTAALTVDLKHVGPTPVNDFKHLRFGAVSLFLQTLGLFQMKCKNVYKKTQKKPFRPLSNGLLCFLFSSGRMLLTSSQVLKRIDVRNVTVVATLPKTSVRGGF